MLASRIPASEANRRPPEVVEGEKRCGRRAPRCSRRRRRWPPSRSSSRSRNRSCARRVADERRAQRAAPHVGAPRLGGRRGAAALDRAGQRGVGVALSEDARTVLSRASRRCTASARRCSARRRISATRSTSPRTSRTRRARCSRTCRRLRCARASPSPPRRRSTSRAAPSRRAAKPSPTASAPRRPLVRTLTSTRCTIRPSRRRSAVSLRQAEPGVHAGAKPAAADAKVGATFRCRRPEVGAEARAAARPRGDAAASGAVVCSVSNVLPYLYCADSAAPADRSRARSRATSAARFTPICANPRAARPSGRAPSRSSRPARAARRCR